MDANCPNVPSVVLRVLQFSAFIVALSLLGGIGIGWITHKFIFGATFGTLCFFSVFVALIPFQQDIRGIPLQGLRTRTLILIETSILLAVVYFLSMITMRSMDHVGFTWLSDPRQPYIIAPACFYGVVLIAMAVSLAASRLRKR